MKLKQAIIPLAIFNSGVAFADHAETHKLDDISVTASRDARPTQMISQAVSVIDQETIDDWNVLNVSDALKNMPGVVTKTTSGGYSSRIAIRGAGIKAPYGVREISILRDGVPVTDPDGFSRLDFIDPQDIAQIEVVKGPGSIYSYGSSGGTIQILSRSVFDTGSDRVRVGGGSYDRNTQNIRYSGNITEDDFYALTWSRQDSPNSWRDNNEYERNNASVKYGHLFEDDSKFEMELSYTNSNLQLPQMIRQDEFNIWEAGGDEVIPEGNPNYGFRHRARDSNVVFLNTSYEKDFGDIKIKPRFYVNYWDHWHPVSGISAIPKQIVIGGDFQLDWNHTLFDREAKLIAGVIGRNDRGRSLRYDYADKEYKNVCNWRGCNNTFQKTLSERPGRVVSTGEEDNFDFGTYLAYTFRPLDKLTVDMNFRYDRIHLNVDNNEFEKFNYSTRDFSTTGASGLTQIDSEFDIVTGRFGATYDITDQLNGYFNFGYGDQVPSASEMRNNIIAGVSSSIQPASSYLYEGGFKFRDEIGSFNLAFYYSEVENEVLNGRLLDGSSYYVNAGRSEKLGLEVDGQVYVPFVDGLSLGANYTWNDHVISDWVYKDAESGTETDYSGNTFNKIPRHMYTLFANYEHPSGFNTSVRSRVQSKYWKNNENSAKSDPYYGGLNFITDLTVGYTYGPHKIQGNMDNVFDKHYAADARVSGAGLSYESHQYSLGAPRTWMVTYQYSF